MTLALACPAQAPSLLPHSSVVSQTHFLQRQATDCSHRLQTQTRHGASFQLTCPLPISLPPEMLLITQNTRDGQQGDGDGRLTHSTGSHPGPLKGHLLLRISHPPAPTYTCQAPKCSSDAITGHITQQSSTVSLKHMTGDAPKQIHPHILRSGAHRARHAQEQDVIWTHPKSTIVSKTFLFPGTNSFPGLSSPLPVIASSIVQTICLPEPYRKDN